MITLDSRELQMDSLLDNMAASLQLDNTRHQRMVQSYEAIKHWIETDEEFFKPFSYEVYPHGSVRIFTTVKPLEKEEFDLDVVIHFKSNFFSHTPQRIYEELKRRLAEHEVYVKMLEAKSRVLRLNYAGDFHMDLMPGIQETGLDNNKIKVPDRQLGNWVSSNPRGYADWFIGKADMAETSLLEKALKSEKIQSDDFANKKPLQRALQLIKRHRDVYFKKDGTYKTNSIILTTIAGELYRGEQSIYDALDRIITEITPQTYMSERIKVLNPVNPEEDFTDKWDTDPEYYEAFIDFVRHLHNEWNKLKKENGIIAEGRIFKGLFGEKVFNKAIIEQSKLTETTRRNKSLGMVQNTGALTMAITPNSDVLRIKNNTFFGK